MRRPRQTPAQASGCQRQLWALAVSCLLGLWVFLPVLDANASATHTLHSPPTAWLAARVVRLQAPGPAMIRVPAGRFSMGSSLEEIMLAAELCQRHAPAQVCQPEVFANEKAPHGVDLSTYWLDRTEVSVQEYERCVAQRRCPPLPYAQGALRFQKPEFPVSLVTWHEAETYCRWRGARLPTEAEFERAGRGLGHRRFAWGDIYNSRVANHGRFGVADTDDSDGFDELAPVASFQGGATPDGFMDLGGNVAEWVYDYYSAEYERQNVRDPTGPPASSSIQERIIRGGHFRSAPVWLRNAARQARSPVERAPYVGFRCAKSRHEAPKP